MFAVVSTLTASPEIIGHIESVHRDLRQAVEKQQREGAWMIRIVLWTCRSARYNEAPPSSTGLRGSTWYSRQALPRGDDVHGLAPPL